MGKLTKEQIQETINLYQSGLSMLKIAHRFNITESSVRGLLFRRGIQFRNPGEYRKRSLEDRFWEKVNKNGPFIIDTPCWEWTGSLTKGYGYIGINNCTKNEYAHRLSWIMAYGEIPDKLHVLHKCDNSKCVNPDHLWIGTNKDNQQDMIRKGRHNPVSFPGQSNPSAKLTNEQVIEENDLRKENRTKVLYLSLISQTEIYTG